MASLSDHPRYRQPWRRPFDAAVDSNLRPGATILDVGGGRSPAIQAGRLPVGARYVGLDIQGAELAAAPPGSYSDLVVADVTERVPRLNNSVDLAVSWQVLEHVSPLPVAVENVRQYVRPGGRFIAHLSGGRSFFAIANRAVPHAVARMGLRLLLGRDPSTVFPAPYDHCTYSGLSAAFSQWSSVTIVPRYRGAAYLNFLPFARDVYLRFEDLAAKGRHRDLATHYLIVAER